MRRLSALSSYRVPLAITEEFVAILRRAVLYLRRQISAAGSRVVERDACPGVSFPDNAQHCTTYRADNLAHTDCSRPLPVRPPL